MSESLSDAELMRRIARRDDSALETLYDRYASAVMGLALKTIGNRERAEEVVQETFWRAWRKVGTYRAEKGSALSWLFGIAHHLSIDLIRRRGQHPVLIELQDMERDQAQEDEVSEAVWAAERRRQVAAAVAALPEPQRRVLELAYFGGLTRREIAELTETPLGTVHTRARLALGKLREALREEGAMLDK